MTAVVGPPRATDQLPDDDLQKIRLRVPDALRLGLLGPRTRRLRAALSALGIALGIASVVAVTGISASNQANLLAQFDKLGSNVLAVAPGTDAQQNPVALPPQAEKMLGFIAPVQAVTATGGTKAHIYRNNLIPIDRTGSISVLAARPNLIDVLHVQMDSGRWLDAAAQNLPETVLGSLTAGRLGVTAPGQLVWLGGQWFTVIGILQSSQLVPGLDISALVGWPEATAHLGADATANVVYLRVYPDQVTAVQSVAGGTANPAHPETVQVSKPSDLLKAREAANSALTGLVLALAGVALLVGGVGIANTMVVGVMERRGEVGLRRALGARSGQIAAQFFLEAVLLGALGGLAGMASGVLGVVGFALVQGWPITIPLAAVATGPAAAILVAGAAGLYPARRAARVAPTDALRSA